MLTKMFELRDKSTFIPILCIEMLPTIIAGESRTPEQYIAERYLLRRRGYDVSGDSPAILLIAENQDRCSSDPYFWGDRTFQTAHDYITKNWPALISGQVIDVEFILGETSISKPSERISNKDF